MAAALTKAIGQEVRYNDVPPEVYRSSGFPGADDLGNMFQFKRRFGSNATLAIAAKRHRGGFRSTVERPRWPRCSTHGWRRITATSSSPAMMVSATSCETMR